VRRALRSDERSDDNRSRHCSDRLSLEHGVVPWPRDARRDEAS